MANETMTVDSVNEAIGSIKRETNDTLNGFLAKLEEGLKPAEKVEVTPEDKADLEEKLLSKLSGTKPFGLPVGEAFAGGAVAVVVGEVVDMVAGKVGFGATTVSAAAVKGVAAFLSAKYLKKWVGPTAGNAAALLLTYDAIRTIIPFDSWIREKIPGHNPLEFGTRPMTGSNYSAVNEATRVATDAMAAYYPSVKGRSG